MEDLTELLYCQLLAKVLVIEYILVLGTIIFLEVAKELIIIRFIITPNSHLAECGVMKLRMF